LKILYSVVKGALATPPVAQAIEPISLNERIPLVRDWAIIGLDGPGALSGLDFAAIVEDANEIGLEGSRLRKHPESKVLVGCKMRMDDHEELNAEIKGAEAENEKSSAALSVGEAGFFRWRLFHTSYSVF